MIGPTSQEPKVAVPRAGLRTISARPSRDRLAAVLAPFVIPGLLLALWSAIGVFEWIPKGLVPTPRETFVAFVTWIFGPASQDPYSGTWLRTVLASAHRVLLGFAVATAGGLVVGVLMATSRPMAALLEPLFNSIRPIPIPAWVPFTLIFFGLTLFASVALVVLAAFPPMVINTMTGVQRANPLWIRAAQMLGASRGRILLRVLLPASLPSIFAGLRISIGMSWLAVVVAEIVGVHSGIGYTIYESYYFNRVDILICDMVTVGIFGLVSDRVIYVIGARVCRWY
jgi:ABC-type nitrate/sulfonate/bicarbonate transport system permease component